MQPEEPFETKLTKYENFFLSVLTIKTHAYIYKGISYKQFACVKHTNPFVEPTLMCANHRFRMQLDKFAWIRGTLKIGTIQ